MARKYLVPIDLSQQELQNAVIQKLATAPGSPVSGQIYYDTVKGAAFYYNGSTWINMGGSVARDTLANRPAASSANANTLFYATDNHLLYVSDGSTWSQISAFGSGESTTVSITGSAANGTSTNYARADHTHGGPGFDSVVAGASFGMASANGTATTVARSDHFHGTPAHTDTEHSGIHLNALAAPTADVSMNSHKLTSVTDPTSAQDAATKNYVDTRSLSNFSAPTADLSIGTHKLTNVTDPASAQDAATKNYVDTRKVTDLTAPTSDFSMNSHKITNVSTPTSDYDAANKLYVDNSIQGLTWKPSVNLLSASNIALTGSTGSLSVDGHTALNATNSGYRLLLTGQSTGSQNGIYLYTDAGSGYTLTRATDADNYTELIGASVFVEEGTTYGKTSWVQSNHYLTDFSNQLWVQFAGAGTYTASNGVTLVATDFQFAPKSDGGLQTDSGGASIKLRSMPGSGLQIDSNGLSVKDGTGILVGVAGVTIDTSVVATKYSVAVGDGSATSYTVTHNLGTRDVMVSVRETSSPYAKVEPDIAMATTNTVTVSFAVAPTSNQYTVTVIG